MYVFMFGKEIFVIGDLNCNMLSDCLEVYFLGDLCDSLNFMQFIKIFIRVIFQFLLFIDVILVFDVSLVVDSGVEEMYISDYFLVYFKLEFK